CALPLHADNEAPGRTGKTRGGNRRAGIYGTGYGTRRARPRKKTVRGPRSEAPAPRQQQQQQTAQERPPEQPRPPRETPAAPEPVPEAAAEREEPAEPPFEPISASETLYDTPDGFWDEADSAPAAALPARQPQQTPRSDARGRAPAAAPPAAREGVPPADSGDGKLTLLQELFPGRVLSRVPLV